MKRRESKYLTKEAALSVIMNFNYFGYPIACFQEGVNRYRVTAPAWAWSFVVLTAEDYA